MTTGVMRFQNINDKNIMIYINEYLIYEILREPCDLLVSWAVKFGFCIAYRSRILGFFEEVCDQTNGVLHLMASDGTLR